MAHLDPCECDLGFTDACGCFTDVLYDTVIKNGTIVDPKTEVRTIANIGIRHRKIAVVTRAALQGKSEVDAMGKIVCPGFVDPHSQADGQLSGAQAMAPLGVTTIVIGSCGSGPHPTRPFLMDLYAEGYPLNCGVLTPVSCILREKAGVPGPHATATDQQIETIAGWVEQDLLEGAAGVALGLEEAPGTTWEELKAIAQVAAKYDKIVSIHPRAGDGDHWETNHELSRLQETTGAHILISPGVDPSEQGKGILAELASGQDGSSLVETVKKATWLPAQLFGFKCKGWIGEGADADLVVFDLERLKANAAARGSGAAAVFSEGIEHVFVNGEPVIKNGHLVEDARPGRALMPKTRIWRL